MKTFKQLKESLQVERYDKDLDVNKQIGEAKGSFRAGYQKAKKRFSDVNKQIGEEIELDESGNPIKRLNALDFDTRGKAAVASIKGNSKKEHLYSKQLKTLKKLKDKLALENTDIESE
jgi:hypothetical protein